MAGWPPRAPRVAELARRDVRAERLALTIARVFF